MAIMNVTVTAVVCRRLLALNPVTGLIPVFFLIPTCLLGSVSSIYFAIYNPGSMRWFGGKIWLHMHENFFFQCMVLIHILAFALPWLLLISPSRRSLSYDRFIEAAKAVAGPTFMIFTVVVGSLLALRLANINKASTTGYLVYGFFRYMDASPMVCGMAWHLLSLPLRWQVLAILGLNTLINTATNSRFYAFIPPLFFGAGLMFVSRVSLRRKYIALVASIAVLAIVMVVGNAARRVGGGLWLGGVESLRRQMEIVSTRSEKILDNVSWGDEIFGRMFFLGGHQIVTLMPTEHTFKEWNIPLYILEVVGQGMLPRGLANRLIEPHHENKNSLLLIGHRLSKSHSVERSFIGAAWELGGVGPLIIISCLASLFLRGMAALLDQLFLFSPRFAVIAFVAVCDAAMWSINEGLPSMAHECIYSVIVMAVVYQAVRLVGSMFYGSTFSRYGVSEVRTRPMQAA
jgi:hypothetical protein